LSAREHALDRLAALIAGSPHNLVSAAQRPRVREDHIEEAVALAPVLPLAPGSSWVDVGTGAGLPGLVLAICRPDVDWLLVDARRKKAAAVAEFAAQLALENVVVAAERAEVLAHREEHRGRYDGVVTRAVGRLAVVAELSRGFLRPGGLVAAVKGPAWTDEAQEATAAAAGLGMRPPEAIAVPSPTRSTWVVTMVAVGGVPRAVPRRSGVRPRPSQGGDER
jgi:16S rRNA (guanine527-N7)-methyltransferase